ncbi:hypothetical protein BIW11_04487 [Tropilaelaps mercedesae]|uniref:Uncharacterized protein n=1 Tax=Tropilaelaps mercedesae TaxID=418985 RepID=A0A1V9X603_9ACAR|nr:hypothetical protein BIW11_04487 [Tropilaelaps mercedesae]
MLSIPRGVSFTVNCDFCCTYPIQLTLARSVFRAILLVKALAVQIDNGPAILSLVARCPDV